MTKKIMKTKKLRKTLAVVMIASLCMSQLTVGSLGAEISTDTVPTPAGNVDVTVTTEITTTETTEHGKTTETTITTETWTSELTPDVEADDTADPNVETEVVVTGQETFTETTTTDSQGRVVYESEELKGHEQIDITTTTTIVGNPQENVLISEETKDLGTADEYTIEKLENTSTDQGTWQNGTPEAASDWIIIDETEGDWSSTNPGNPDTSNDGTENIVFEDPLTTQDVTLTFVQKTGGTAKEERQAISLQQLADGKLEGVTLVDGKPTIENKRVESTDADGNKVVTTYELKETQNGYELIKNVTTITVTPTPGTPTPPAADQLDDNGVSGGAATPTLDADLNEILTTGTEETNSNGETVKTKTETSVNNDGDHVNVKTDIREIKDASGKVIGYEVTKTTTTTMVKEQTNTASAPTTTSDNPAPEDEFTLPSRPTASDITSETGERTVITVEDVKDSHGTVVGYKSIKVDYDANGEVIMKSSETIYGTTKKYNSTTEIDPTTEIVTTTTTVVETEVTNYSAKEFTRETDMTSVRTDHVTTTEVTDTTKYQLVTTDDGTYFIYEGKMYRVIASGDHGNVDITSIEPNLSLTPSGNNGAVNDDRDLRNPSDTPGSNDGDALGIKDGYDFEYIGYGLESSIKALTSGSSGTLVHQFKLIDRNNQTHYVLCADFSTTAQGYTDYNMVDVEAATYYNSTAAQKIKAIALNGYWGTTVGIGSLEECRKVLRNWLQENNITNYDANNLTEGQALTATQAAIWNYGNSGNTQMNPQDVAGSKYGGSLTTFEQTGVNYFYQALLALDPDKVNDPSTPLITENNFATETAIVIKDKSDTRTENTDNNTENDVYNSDLSFTLEMKKTDVNGDLVVHVIDNEGNTIASRRLSGQNSDGQNYELFGASDAIEDNGKTTYTIRDIQLTENVTITLQLSGTQYLAQGVYLYSAPVYDTSQTFVGVSSGNRNVNLSVNLEFEVHEPEASLTATTTKSGREKTDTTTYEKSYKRTDTRIDESRSETYERNATTTENTEVYATLTVTDITVETSRTENSWERGLEKSTRYTSERDNDDDGSKGDGEKSKKNTDNLVDVINISDDDVPLTAADIINIQDPEIPLAVLPMTGDVSVFWLFLSAISGLGLAGLTFSDKKKKDYPDR